MLIGNKSRALTLAEIVLAIGLLAILALTIIGVFVKLMGSQTKSSHTTVGRLLANKVAERAILSGPPNWGMVNIDTPQEEVLLVGDQDKPVTFTIEVRVLPLKSAPTTNPMGSLHFVEAEVSWWGGEDRVDFGKTKVKTSRVVYIEE